MDELLHVSGSAACDIVKCLYTHIQVLLHGCLLSEQNIDSILDCIRRDLEKIETCLADSLRDVIPGHRDVSVVAAAISWSVTILFVIDYFLIYCRPSFLDHCVTLVPCVAVLARAVLNRYSA